MNGTWCGLIVMDRCGNEIKHNYAILWNICGKVMEKVSIYFYKGMEKVVEMKSLYRLHRFYKYKRIHEHFSSLQREIIKVDIETGDYTTSHRTTNLEFLCSNDVQNISKRLKIGDMFYAPARYGFPHVPKYYK